MKNKNLKSIHRQIVLDTETTGLDPLQGHRIIEIGCVELVNRRLTSNRFHYYLQPDRAIDLEAVKVHGITNEFLAEKPRFADIAADFLKFVKGAELVIHNAPFDIGFLNHELSRWGQGWNSLTEICTVLDSLQLARRRHPGQKNTLDALCKRYEIDNTQRSLHGALLDAEILADVYLAMTREQVSLGLSAQLQTAPPLRFRSDSNNCSVKHIHVKRKMSLVLRATEEERNAHQRYLEVLDKNSGGNCLWKRLKSSH
jgi:DNA polymerase-3 subunit epsilon